MRDVLIDVIEKLVEQRTVIGLDLDPQGGRRSLLVDARIGFLEANLIRNAQAAGFDRSGGALERGFAVAGYQDRRSIEASVGWRRVGQIGVHRIDPSQCGTEQPMLIARISEKSRTILAPHRTVRQTGRNSDAV